MTLVDGLARYARTLLTLPRDIHLFFAYALFSNVAIGAFALLYNLYLVQLRYREDFIGLVNAISTAALAVSAVGLGKLLHDRGPWWCLFYGTAFYLVTSMLLAFASQPLAVVASAVLQGMATTFLFVPLMPFVIEHAPPAQRPTVAAMALSLTSASATVGSLLAGGLPSLIGTLTGWPVSSAVTYRWSLLASIVVCAGALPPLLLMHDPRGPATHTTGSLRVQEEGVTDSQWQLRQYLRAFVLAGGLLSIGNGAVVPFYNVFLTTLGLSAQAIGVFYAAASLTGAVLGLFAPAVARALGPLHAATFIRFAPIPLFALLALFPATPLAIVAHLVRMTSISMAWPIDSMLIAEVLPSAVRANAFSFRSAAWNLGFAVASLLSGQLIVALGYGPAFAIYALFCTLAVAYFQRRFRQHPAAQGHRGRVQPASGPER